MADACLIAAAPDLLEVLAEMLPRFESLREVAGCDRKSDLGRRARAAITKATAA